MKSQKLTAIILFINFYFLLINCFAQQTPQYTQFMLNNYGMNPAACGVSPNKYEALVGLRRQWIGFDNMPVTQFANINTYFGKRNGLNHAWHGVGVYYQGDKMGNMISTNDYYASYTLLVRLDRKGYISFGMAAGARSYSFAPPLIFNDPAIVAKNLWMYPDVIPGVKFWNNKWSYDLSVKQLYKYKAQQGGDMIGTNAKLPPHLYFAVTRKWWPRSYLLVLQSLYVKYTFSSLPSFDYNMLAFLNKNFAVGISYRHLDAVAGVFQYRFDKLVIGIAYDYSIAPYRIGFANTQEFMIGLAPSPYYGGANEMKHYRTAECPQFQY